MGYPRHGRHRRRTGARLRAGVAVSLAAVGLAAREEAAAEEAAAGRPVRSSAAPATPWRRPGHPWAPSRVPPPRAGRAGPAEALSTGGGEAVHSLWTTGCRPGRRLGVAEGPVRGPQAGPTARPNFALRVHAEPPEHALSADGWLKRRVPDRRRGHTTSAESVRGDRVMRQGRPSRTSAHRPRRDLTIKAHGT